MMPPPPNVVVVVVCRWNVLALVVVSFLLAAGFIQDARAWEPIKPRPQRNEQQTRRVLFEKAFKSLFTTSLAGHHLSFETTAAHAACLPGDASTNCIGVYKIPFDYRNDIQSNINSGIRTGNNNNSMSFSPPRKVRFFMGDLPPPPRIGMIPTSYEEAIKVLGAQRLATNDIMAVILAGRLEEGGLKVLNLIPRVNIAGRLVIQTALTLSRVRKDSLAIQQLKEMQLESALNQLLVGFNECDVMIGQGLRGEMGVVTVAQLYILHELQDTIRAYDDFLVVAEKLS